MKATLSSAIVVVEGGQTGLYAAPRDVKITVEMDGLEAARVLRDIEGRALSDDGILLRQLLTGALGNLEKGATNVLL